MFSRTRQTRKACWAKRCRCCTLKHSTTRSISRTGICQMITTPHSSIYLALSTKPVARRYTAILASLAIRPIVAEWINLLTFQAPRGTNLDANHSFPWKTWSLRTTTTVCATTSTRWRVFQLIKLSTRALHKLHPRRKWWSLPKILLYLSLTTVCILKELIAPPGLDITKTVILAPMLKSCPNLRQEASDCARSSAPWAVICNRASYYRLKRP